MPPTRCNRPLDPAEQTRQDEALFQELGRSQVQLDSDFDDYEDHLLIHRDYHQDPERVFQTTGFTVGDFWSLYSIVNDNLRAQFGTRGRKPRFGPEDTFYIMLQYLRHNASYTQLALLYSTTITVICETLRRAIAGCRQPLVSTFIKPLRKAEQMELGIQFPQFPEVALVIDCSVQECARPAGAFSSHQRLFFSGKHCFHCYKREYAHLPNGVTVFVSDVFPGSYHDMHVSQTMTAKYATFLAKGHDEDELADPEPDARSWAVMADKAYTGLDNTLRCVVPRKDMRAHPLTADDRARNRLISSNRIVVENFYGRKWCVFHVAREVFYGNMSKFACVDDIMTALTNYHVGKYPLRAEDGNSYRALLHARLAEAARLDAKQHARNREYQRRYRERSHTTRREESHMVAPSDLQ
jgi:IS5 family transposase